VADLTAGLERLEELCRAYLDDTPEGQSVAATIRATEPVARFIAAVVDAAPELIAVAKAAYVQAEIAAKYNAGVESPELSAALVALARKLEQS
jgi:hypothetical protein